MEPFWLMDGTAQVSVSSQILCGLKIASIAYPSSLRLNSGLGSTRVLFSDQTNAEQVNEC